MTDTDGFVAPEYHHRSLGDVVPAVAYALGKGGPAHGLAEAPADLVLPEAAAYVVFLIDGLGWRLLERHREAAPFLASLLDGAGPATAGVPSTTATSLTSLGTGLPPGAHGVVGFTSRVPGTERLLNALLWDKSVDPLEWQPHQTAFGWLRQAGGAGTGGNKRGGRGGGVPPGGKKRERGGAGRRGSTGGRAYQIKKKK